MQTLISARTRFLFRYCPNRPDGRQRKAWPPFCTGVTLAPDIVKSPCIFFLIRFTGPKTTTGVTKDGVYMKHIFGPVIFPGNTLILFVEGLQFLPGRQAPIRVTGISILIEFLKIVLRVIPIDPDFFFPDRYQSFSTSGLHANL